MNGVRAFKPKSPNRRALAVAHDEAVQSIQQVHGNTTYLKTEMEKLDLYIQSGLKREDDRLMWLETRLRSGFLRRLKWLVTGR